MSGKNAQIKSETDIANNRMFNEYLSKIYSGLDDYAETQKKDAEEKFREENKYLDMAKMADFVYHSDSIKKLPEGWDIATGLPGNTQQVLDGFNSDKIKDGFYAEIYYNEKTKEYVLAFQGTDFNKIEHLTTDAGQAAGSTVLSGQYFKAQDLAQLFKKNCQGCSISITGHSLGGGLASVAGLASGLPTYTFNAAGVHPNTIKKIDNQARAKEKEIIKAYYTEDDPLSTLQDKGYVNLLKNNPKIAGATLGTVVGAEVINTIPGGTELVEMVAKEHIGEKTDLETGIATSKAIGETLNNPISTLLSLPPALGKKINLGNTECEGIGCGHKIEPLIKLIEAPLEEEKMQIDISKDNLKMTLSNCAASE